MIAIVCGTCQVATSLRGEESLLGLPASTDSSRPGAVVLHGGGRISEDAFDRFVELAGGREANIVFVPSAGYRVADYESEAAFLATVSWRYGSWVGLKSSGRVRQFTFLYTDNPDDADNQNFTRPLEKATGVWFSGGSQSRLNYRYVGEFPQRTRFQELLRQVVARGGVIGGTSAGTAALPEIMTLWEDRDYDGAPARAVAAHGLGLFTKAIVEQHFDAREGRLERFTNLLRDNDRLERLTRRAGSGPQMCGIAVEEPAALIVHGNQLSVLGRGSAHLFLKSNGGSTLTWHEIKSGESATLRRTPQQDLAIGTAEVRLLRK